MVAVAASRSRALVAERFQCLIAIIFRPPPSHTCLFCADSSCTNYPRILRPEALQSRKIRVPAACRRRKSSRSRADRRRSVAAAELCAGRVSSLIPSCVVALHNIRSTARDWNGCAGTRNPRSELALDPIEGRARALPGGSLSATKFRPHAPKQRTYDLTTGVWRSTLLAAR
jgi:hypothetical protein